MSKGESMGMNELKVPFCQCRDGSWSGNDNGSRSCRDASIFQGGTIYTSDYNYKFVLIRLVTVRVPDKQET